MQLSARNIFASMAMLTSTQALADINLLNTEEYQANIHGYFSLSYYDNDNRDSAELIDGWSRVGLNFTHQLTDGWEATAVAEWGFAVVDTKASLELQAGNGLRPQGTGDDTFWNRQGNIALHHDKWGTVKFGKQWSVYYDTVYSTDYYAHLSAYTGGTYNYADGGISGVGRADGAISYRNQWGPLSLGLQYQPQSETVEALILDNDQSNGFESTDVAEVGDAYGISTTYQWDDIKFSLAYNLMEIENLVNNLPTGDDKILAGSIVYGNFSQYGLFAAVISTSAENHELDNVGNFFDTKSLEVTFSYKFQNNVALYTTYQKLEEDDNDYQGQYDISEVLFGSRYFWTPKFSVFIEAKIDDSDNFAGDSIGEDILLIGAQAKF